MITAAREGDARAAEVAREIAWEQLHCGPWHSVQPIWREAYSMACLHVAKHHFSTGDFSETLKTLDLGLIMGGTLLRVDLESGVDKVMGVTAMEERENGNGNINGGLLFSSVDFNEDEVRFVFLFLFLFTYLFMVFLVFKDVILVVVWKFCVGCQ